MLPAIGLAGQERLATSRVLIVGIGGLGSPAAMYLAAAGVGRLVLADCDAVDLSNLQRQIVHTTHALGRAKVDSARATLAALNPHVQVEGIKRTIDSTSLPDLLNGVDVVVDASDNFATRFAINRGCFAAGVPLISGAAIRTEGQIAVYSGRPGGPCYRCLYPDDDGRDANCSLEGVLSPVVGIIGAIQANETIKVLLGIGEPLYGRLLLLDAMAMEWRCVKLIADSSCPVCQG